MKHILMIGKGQRFVMRHQLSHGHHKVVHHHARHMGIMTHLKKEEEMIEHGRGKTHRRPDGVIMQKRPIKFRF
jgi:hypothetical protein